MPHMSRMYWSMMFISSYLMLSLIYTNMFYLKYKKFKKMMSITLQTENDLKIKMNCKFTYGLYNPLEMYL